MMNNFVYVNKLNNRCVSISIAAILTVALVFGGSFYRDTDVYADKTEAAGYADKLTEMGLLLNPKEDYNLDRKIGVTMILKLMGYDQESVQSGKYGKIGKFNDVPEWFSGYADLAAQLNITNGVSANRFAPNSPLTEKQFVCFLLRALGYDLHTSWNNTEAVAKQIGLIKTNRKLKNSTLTKKNAAEYLFKSMSRKLQGKDTRYFAMKLIEDEVITQDDAVAVGLIEFSSGILSFTHDAQSAYGGDDGKAPVNMSGHGSADDYGEGNIDGEGNNTYNNIDNSATLSMDELFIRYHVDDDFLSADEVELIKLVQAYRKSSGRKPLLISKSLTKVARCHVLDSNTNHPENQITPDNKKGNLHSWSFNSGLWEGVVYTPDHKHSNLMWSKPSELTDYTDQGYEISCWNSASITPKSAMTLWKGSPSHNALLLSKGIWDGLVCMGVAVQGEYAHIWFGTEADPAGYYK